MKVSKKILMLLAVCFALTVVAMPLFAQEKKAAKPKKPVIEGKINLNTAKAEQLIILPGISKKTADAIVAYRTKNGNFKAVDDLMKIKGIKKKRIEKLKPFLALEGDTTLVRK